MFECEVCFQEFDVESGVRCHSQSGKYFLHSINPLDADLLPDEHVFCQSCVKRHVEMNVMTITLSSNFEGIDCFHMGCEGSIRYGTF